MVLTRPEAATLALFALGGDKERVETEDVAVRVAEIAPGMFSWQKYRDYIDKELVRVALSDARLKAGFVIGSHARGWMLTPAGLDFARKRNEQPRMEAIAPRPRPEDRQLRRERARLLMSDAYLRMSDGGLDAVSPDEADAFFRLNAYVRGEGRERKIARIENQFGDDAELGPVVRALAALARERNT